MKFGIATSILLAALVAGAAAQERLTEQYLERGELKKAQEVVRDVLVVTPDLHELTLQLALIQVLQALERYSAELYRIGLRTSPFNGELPFLRFPVPPNPNPAMASNDEVRAALDRLKNDLLQAQSTLSKIPDSWQGKVPFRVGRVHLDLDGSGKVTQDEELWRVLERLNPRLGLSEKTARSFGLRLDVGDVRWLEGYCRLISGFAETILAHDTQALFDRTGHLFFERVESPFPFLALPGQKSTFSIENISDVIAFIHLLNLPVRSPEKLQVALSHFEETVRLSRRSWNCILAETDQDYEWLPNPNQRSAVAGWTVTPEMVTWWFQFLDEAESLLAGTTLMPFWRETGPKTGVNIRRIFLEPAPFDLVLWVQGSAASPYLEEGAVVPRDLWDQLDRVFDGRFLGFAVWFN